MDPCPCHGEARGVKGKRQQFGIDCRHHEIDVFCSTDVGDGVDERLVVTTGHGVCPIGRMTSGTELRPPVTRDYPEPHIKPRGRGAKALDEFDPPSGGRKRTHNSRLLIVKALRWRLSSRIQAAPVKVPGGHLSACHVTLADPPASQ